MVVSPNSNGQFLFSGHCTKDFLEGFLEKHNADAITYTAIQSVIYCSWLAGPLRGLNFFHKDLGLIDRGIQTMP